MKMFVEIHIAGSNPERHELVGERVTLGTAEVAMIRFNQACGFGAELVEVFPGEQGVRVDIPTGMKGTLTFEGTEQRRVRVPFGGEVFVGTGRLTFLKVLERRRSPVVMLGATVALLALGLQVYRSSVPEDPTTHDVAPPGLFDGQAAEVCAEAQADVALGKAQNDERAAYAKVERSAFVVEDGVVAVRLFQHARACYEVAGKSAELARMVAELQRQTERLNEQYATLRLRLRVALDKDRYSEALGATRDLQGLLSKQADSSYRRWLGQLEQTLERKAAKKDGAPLG